MSNYHPPVGSKKPDFKKPSINFKALGKAIKYLWKGNKVPYIIVLISLVFSSILSVLSMTQIETLIDVHIPAITDAYASGIGLDEAFRSFYLFIGYWAALFVGSTLFTLFQNLILPKISQRCLKQIRDEMFTKMQYLPVRFFDSNKYGDIMSRYTNDVDTLDNFITQTVPNLFAVLIQIVSIFITMLINSWILTLFVLFAISMIMLLSSVILKKSTALFRERQMIIGEANGFVEEMMEGEREIQVFNHQGKSMDDYAQINEKYRIADKNANIYSNIIGPLSMNLIRIEYVITATLGAVLITLTKGKVNPYTIGSLCAFLNLSNNFAQPISRITMQFNQIAMAGAGAERIFELIESEKEEDNGYVTLVNATVDNKGKITEVSEKTGVYAWKHPHQEDGSVTYTLLKGDIVLDKVDFSYNSDRQILYDIDIFAHAGQRIALVGETGAGKTTITNLINRFYDIEDGKIRYDGININKIKKADLRRSLGLVLQETSLFTGTIRDNIALGKEDATDEEIIEAAKLANCDSFIRQMPDGYNTKLIKGGENLSQGQRQLLAIARAAIADCPVLILDEATSSIDTRTEVIVQEGMDKLMQGRTVFVIAHRLSTIESSDCIMVMEHGHIIERGPHKELLEQKGIYYSLYTGKFELN